MVESWRVYFTESETQIKRWRVYFTESETQIKRWRVYFTEPETQIKSWRVGEFILLSLRHRLRVGEFILLSTVTPLKRWGNTAVKWGLYRGVFLSNHKMLSLYDRTEEKERCQ